MNTPPATSANELEALRRENARLRSAQGLPPEGAPGRDDADPTEAGYQRNLARSRDAWKTSPTATAHADGPAPVAGEVDPNDQIEAARQRNIERGRNAGRA